MRDDVFVFPMSSAQERLWFLHQLEPDSASYNLPAAVKLTGALDVALVERTVREIVARHEALRTTLDMVDGERCQLVHEAAHLRLSHIDLSELPEATREGELARIVEREVRRPFALATGPLLRVLLVRLARQEHVLLWVVHHAVFDGWSTQIVLREFAALYGALQRGEGSPLAPLALQYADFADWERKRLESGALAEQLAYWKARLQGDEVQLELPTDHARPAVQRHRGARHFFRLSSATSAALRTLAQREGTTLYALLLAGYQALLVRYTGQRDLRVGTPVTNRSRVELEALVGCFANTVVVRTEIADDPSFVSLLSRVHDEVRAAQANQEVPFDQVVEALRPKRDLSRAPLCQVLFALQPQLGRTPSIAGLGVQVLDLDTGAAQFDLALELALDDDGMAGAVEYDSDLFEPATIERFAVHYQRLLEAALHTPEARISELAIMSATEQRELCELAAPTPPRTGADCVTRRIREQAERRPAAIAVVHEERTLSYGLLVQRASQLAQLLSERGVGPGARVGICLPRSLAQIVAVLGVLEAHAAYVPLDPGYPSARLATIASEARLAVVITDAVSATLLPSELPQVLLDEELSALSELPCASATSEPHPEQTAYVLYTSGSTGTPKGVAIPRRALARFAESAAELYAIGAADRVLQFASLSFDASVEEIFPCLSRGATLVLRSETMIATPQAFFEAAGALGITVLDLPTSFAHRLVADESAALAIPQGLRAIILGGEALLPERVSRLLRRLPARTRLFNTYGPTEATVVATACEIGHALPPSVRTIPIGVPLAGVQAYVVDPDTLQLVPRGATGELLLGGEGLASGYRERPGLTAARFVPNPFAREPGERLYRTGDRARVRADGQLEFMGRVDGQVKLRGFRIELEEVEARLAMLPGVDECAVLLRGEQEERRLVAYVAGAQLDEAALRRALCEKLPDYMVPAQFVRLDALPQTLQGKLDRRALPEPARADVVHDAAPRGAIEMELARLWCELLGKERLSVRENFFALGGDSILSLQLVARAREAGLSLTPRQVFQHQTIEELARVVEPLSRASEAATAAPEGDVPLTPIQHWFFERMGSHPHHWNQSLMLVAHSAVDFAALRSAVLSVAERHDALRLRFSRGADGFRQHYVSEPGVEVAREDLSTLAASERAAAMTARAAHVQRSLDIEAGPLFRVVLFELGPSEPARLLLVCHHLVVDGVSFRILVEELATAYGQAQAGQSIALPRPSAPFSAWARALATHAAATLQATHADASANAELTRALPVDDPAGGQHEGATVQRVQQFSAEQTQALWQALPAYRLRADELLIAALAQVLATLGGDTRVLLELEGHGRDALPDGELDVSRTVGWFTKLERVCLDLTQGGEPGPLLASVKEQLRGRRETAECKPAAEVSFNYLGVWSDSASGQPFAIAEDEVGPERAPEAPRGYALELDAAIVHGRLRITWSFSGARHHEATMAQLRDDFAAALETLIAHCTSTGSGRYTPSDFPLARLEQPALDLLQTQHSLEDVFPLSPLQQGLLFHSLWEPGRGAYIEQVSCTLHGELDLAAFTEGWKQVMALHPALRTTFVWQGVDEPLQLVHRSQPLTLTVDDLRHLPVAAHAEELASARRRERSQPFDLREGPLLRLALTRVADDVYHFRWTHHHLILDGWSAAVVLRDAFLAYDALRRGVPGPLGMGARYRDFIAWQRAQSPDLDSAFLREQLRGFAEATPLPLARSTRADERAGFGSQERTLTVATTARLTEFARAHELTLATLVQAAWAFVLGRSAGTSDVLFGITVAGRTAPLSGIEEAVGLFINTLPLRIGVPADSTVVGFLEQVARATSELGAHEHCPLSEAQKLAGLPEKQPLFESLLVFENYPADARLGTGVPGLRVQDVGFDEETHYPLTLTVSPGALLELRLTYERARFDDGAAPRLLALVERVLFQLSERAERPLGQLGLTDQTECERLRAFNQTALPHTSVEAVHAQFEACAARHPEQLAVVFDGRQVSYGELNARANQLARALRKRGVGRDILVAVALERSVELVVALLGILKAGGAYVPIDPDYPRERCAFMLEDASAPVLVSTWPIASKLPTLSAQLLCLDADKLEIEQEEDSNLSLTILPSQLAYTIYTSGSTGRPKGAGNSHRALHNRLAWMQAAYELTPADRVLQKTPFSFDVSVWEFFWPLTTGATLVVARPGDHRDPERLGQLISKHGVTTLHFVPPMLEAFLESEAVRACGSLRRVICSGEALPAELARRCFERLDVALHNLYGPTEAAIDVSAWDCARDDRAATLPIGRPIANTQLYVLDRTGQPLPVGMAGELYIGGVQLARGYHGRPALTAERFVPDPFSDVPGARLYRTGDLARQREDGAYEFLGRLDHQVKIRGLRVELGEIEARLLAHEGLREAVVVAREESHGGKRLVAYVSGDALPDTERLREWTALALPAYMVPALVVALPRLPLSPNGKVDRRALPAPADAAVQRAFVAPRSDAEQALAEIWAEVLHLDQVGVEDDFFALGGDSIVSLQIIARAAQRGLSITPKQLFEQPTIAALAELPELRACAPSSPSPQVSEAPDAGLSSEEWHDLLDELER